MMFGITELRTELAEGEIPSREIHYIDVRAGQQVIQLPAGGRYALRFRDPVTSASVEITIPGAAQPGDMLIFGRVDDLRAGVIGGKHIEATTRFRVEGKVENFSDSEKVLKKVKDSDGLFFRDGDLYFCQAWSREEE